MPVHCQCHEAKGASDTQYSTPSKGKQHNAKSSQTSAGVCESLYVLPTPTWRVFPLIFSAELRAMLPSVRGKQKNGSGSGNY